jgi:hypothetical protein
MSTADQEARYVETVQAFSTVYGTVGELTDQEEGIVRRMFRDHCPVREAGRAVLRNRGRWPSEPDPRKTYPLSGHTRALPPHDRFGRPVLRRRT